jgi:Single-strand binding protein family
MWLRSPLCSIHTLFARVITYPDLFCKQNALVSGLTFTVYFQYNRATSVTEQHFQIGNFDREAISTTLSAEAHATRDVAHGDGAALTLADGKAELEVYPTAAVARVTTADARLELFRVPGYTVDPEAGRVVFEQGAEDSKTRLLVGSDGIVFFEPVLRALEPASTNKTTTDDAQVSSTQPSASERPTASQERSSTWPEVPQHAEREPVQLRGRLGQDPWFTSGETGPVIGGFPFAVNPEGRGMPTWHTVYTFDETALQLQDAHRKGDIRRGRLVEVVGEHVSWKEPTETGRTRNRREIHATSVTRVRATKQQPRHS